MIKKQYIRFESRFTEKQIKFIKNQSKKQKVSEAQIIRNAITLLQNLQTK